MGRKGGRKEEGGRKERGGRREGDRERNLSKQKFPAGQRWFTLRNPFTLPGGQYWSFILFLFFLFPKANVLAYFEEDTLPSAKPP